MPSEQITVDEQLKNYWSKSSFKVHIPSKPGQYGIKQWTACNTINGFVCNMQTYNGKIGLASEKNQGKRVVLDMCGSYLNKGRTITCVNFFTSFDLASKLLTKKTCIVGTVHRSIKFLPAEF